MCFLLLTLSGWLLQATLREARIVGDVEVLVLRELSLPSYQRHEERAGAGAHSGGALMSSLPPLERSRVENDVIASQSSLSSLVLLPLPEVSSLSHCDALFPKP